MIMQLTEAQRSVLKPACTREDLCVFPILAKLKGGAVGNVCKSLLKRGLVHEVPAADTMTVWRHDEERGSLTLQATEAGKLALNGEAVPFSKQAPASVLACPLAAPSATQAQVKERRQDALLRLLGRPEGATIADMVEATGWQPHSVRGAISGVIGKKLGLKVTSEKLPDRDRAYRVS
jgi:hypothetical protein